MSDRDIQLFVIGICIGMYLMLFLQILYGILDDRRADRAARRRARILAADRYRDSLRRYQMQQRSRA